MTYERAISTSRSITRRCILAGLTSLLALGSGAVLAQNATINVVGEIVASTCSLFKSDALLDIGTVDQKVFTGLNSESDYSDPDNISTDPTCTATGISMEFDAKADSNNGNLFAVNTGGATGVGIHLEAQIRGVWQQAFPKGSPSATPLTNIIGQQNFRAKYVQSAGTVTTGQANATITVLVTYT